MCGREKFEEDEFDDGKEDFVEEDKESKNEEE